MCVKLLVIVIKVLKYCPSTYCLMQGSCFIWISFDFFNRITSFNLEIYEATKMSLFKKKTGLF